MVNIDILKQHANLAINLAWHTENIFIMDIGKLLELTSKIAAKMQWKC